MGFFDRNNEPASDPNADYYNSLAQSASANGWSPDVGDWFNGKQQTYNAATDGQVGVPVDRNRFNDFLDAHQINQDERNDYYNNYLNQFNVAQAEQQQYQADPHGYTNQKAQELSDQLFNTFTTNGHVFGGRPNMEAENTAALEEIKKVDPNAYYNAQLSLDLRKAGWDAGQGKTNDITNARIQGNIQDALKNGFDPNQIKNIVANNYANTAQWHAQNIADRQGQGAFLQGIEKVAPAFAALITAGALAPAAGALEAGSVAASVAPEIAGSGFYTGAGTFAGEGLGTAAELMGPTYGELGITGLPEGAMGPTYGEMGYTGLNQGQAIAGADAASQGSQALDALNYANKARNLMDNISSLSKLINGGSSGLVGGTSGGTSGGYSSGAGLSSSADTAGTSSGALPGNLQANMLAAAPVMQGSSNMNINQLKQLYPQLANLDPRILSSLTGKSSNVPNFYTYGEGQSAGGTALTNQGSGGSPQPGYPSISSSSKAATTGFASPSSSSSGYNALSAAGLNAITTGALPGQSYYKDGGNVHIPQFKTGTTGHFVQGEGDGQSDDIPAMLADGEYVFDADTVAALGNGSSKAGALQLDKMRQAIRKHKRSASVDKIPPKAKSPLEYMKGK